MRDELRRLIKAMPFMPFTLHMTDGRAFRIPHPDHISVMVKGLIVVQDDEGVVNLLPPLLLAGIETQTPAA